MAPEHEARTRVLYDHESESPAAAARAVADWGVGEDIFDRMPSRRFTRADRRAEHARRISRDDVAPARSRASRSPTRRRSTPPGAPRRRRAAAADAPPGDAPPSVAERATSERRRVEAEPPGRRRGWSPSRREPRRVRRARTIVVGARARPPSARRAAVRAPHGRDQRPSRAAADGAARAGRRETAIERSAPGRTGSSPTRWRSASCSC